MTSTTAIESLAPYYSYASYRNGFCCDPAYDEDQNTVLTYDTGFYILELDVADLTQLKFQKHEDCDETTNTLCYSDALTTPFSDCLPTSALNIAVSVGGSTYTCTGAKLGGDTRKPLNSSVILWEAGKISQRFECIQLEGLSSVGIWSLTMQIWPDAFAFTLVGKQVGDDPVDVTLQANNEEWTQQQCLVPDEYGQVTMTLHCNVARDNATSYVREHVTVTTDGSIALDTKYNPVLHAYETAVHYESYPKDGCIVRKFASGYTDIRDYDDYIIKITDTNIIPYVLSMGNPANVTGMCPMILTEDGIPTGIPVQLSKNWHWVEKGSYAKLYCIFPGPGTYLLRVSYGFYGTLPSASHAQLSLYGYGAAAMGRWDQLAVGCWGETLCLDSESCCVDEKVTDVRGLFFGKEEKNRWNWTHCAWGGDWLSVMDANQQRLFVRNVKVAYLAHGPCLTHVQFHGFYGNHVEFLVAVRTLRTDDYCRTFFTFEYNILDNCTIVHLHSMLNRCFNTPTIAHGHAGGLTEEREAPDGLLSNEVFVENQGFVGSAPFWITFPDSTEFPPNDPSKGQMPDGFKSMIIQSFEATVGGACYSCPGFSLINEKSGWTTTQGEKPSLTVAIELPDGVKDVVAGDRIQMETEWITNSREQGDYYGPNWNYKAFLGINPKSWKIPFREVQLNGSMLSVEVQDGGDLIHKYPVKVNVTSDQGTTIKMTAGVGAVPMEFCGLPDPNYRLYKVGKDNEETILDQNGSAGDDYWQTDFVFSSKTYTMTFNPMIGDEWDTLWRLKKIV